MTRRWGRLVVAVGVVLGGAVPMRGGAGRIDATDASNRETVGTTASGEPRAPRIFAIDVPAGRASFTIDTPQTRSQTLVIVSALARGSGPFPIRLSAAPASDVDPSSMTAIEPIRPEKRMPPTLEAPAPPPSRQLPPHDRTFHLMVRDGDAASASNYLAVAARLRAVGQRVQVYVDARDVGQVGPEVLRELVTTFDDQVFPTLARELGQARDVDGDGRFTILMTGWLTRLAGGRLAVDGFVRGADFVPDVPAPFSNRCDMMYLSTALRSGPHLRTVLAHEYAHAVTYSLKGAGDGCRVEEEGWLDEAQAHLVEDRFGFSRSNLDYRVSAFLSAPERYQLVVEDYYHAGLFRSHGHRGSTYLFLRWCLDQYGPGLLGALARSPQRGVANLEHATGEAFADLYRWWTVALALEGLDPEQPVPGGYHTLSLRGESDGWFLGGPRLTRLAPGATANEVWSAVGTSSRFFQIEGAATGAVRVEVEGPAEAALQVTAIALPPSMTRGPELSVQSWPGSDGTVQVRIRVRERDGTPIRLVALAWEPLAPAPELLEPEARHASLDMLGIARHFGTSALPAHGWLSSRPFPLTGPQPSSGPLVFKLLGTDPDGRPVVAWADLDGGGTSPSSPPRPCRASH